MVRSLTLCVGSGAVYLLLVFDRLTFFVFLFELFFVFSLRGSLFVFTLLALFHSVCIQCLSCPV